MQLAIISKLEEELVEPIQSERQVVYLMVELRKLLELTGEKKNYPALRLHSDWVAHPCLERELAEDIVVAFNRHLKEIDRMARLKPGEAIQVKDDHLAVLNAAVTLTAFRRDLLNYLHSLGLDDSIAGDDGKWAKFLKYYCEVIRDCPLRCVSQNLKFVDSVSVVVDDVSAGTSAAFGIVIRLKWVWKNKVNGQEECFRQFF